MSDGLLIPVALAIQFGGLVFGAGVAWAQLSALKDKNKEDKDRAERDLKELKDKHEKELRELRMEMKSDVASIRNDNAKANTELRTEAQAGREAIRLEMSTMIQTTAEVRAERINQVFGDYEKLVRSIEQWREETRNSFSSITKSMSEMAQNQRDLHWRVANLEEDAREAGWKKTSERAMPAVTGERASSPNHPPYGGRPDVREGFDPRATRDRSR